MPKKSAVQEKGSIARMPAEHSARIDALAAQIPDPVEEEISDDIAAMVEEAESEESPDPATGTDDEDDAANRAARESTSFVEPETIVEKTIGALSYEVKPGEFEETVRKLRENEIGEVAFGGKRSKPSGPISPEIQADVNVIRAAADLMEAYGVPASANVLRVVADAIASGTRVRA